MASLKPMRINEPLVYAVQLQPPNHQKPCKDDEMDQITQEVEFDLNRPLKYFLQSVFKNGGKVVLAFPDSSYGQVSHLVYAYM